MLDHVKRVGGGENPYTHERSRLSVEANVLLVVLRPQYHIGNLAQSNYYSFILLDHQLAKFVGSAQIGVGDQVHRDHGTLGGAERGKMVVLGKCVSHRGSGNAERGHLVGLEPDSHGEGAIAENVGALYAADGAQLRLHDSREVIGDLVLIK